MNFIIRVVAWIACTLLLPRLGLAMEPLPVVSTASTPTAISTPLKGLLADYTSLLPERHQVLIDGVWRSGSDHHDALLRACRVDPIACSLAVRPQFDALLEVNRSRDLKAPVSVRDMLVVSALVGLCNLAFYVEMEYRCVNQRDWVNAASAGWLSLGYDHLFLAYYDQAEEDRRYKRHWLTHEAQLPADDVQRRLASIDQEKGLGIVDALALEQRGYFSAASSQWAQVLLKLMSQSHYEGMLHAVVNLAGLAEQQGKSDRTEQWMLVAKNLLADHAAQNVGMQCKLESARFLIDVEREGRTHLMVDGTQRIRRLIEQGCPFTLQAIQFGQQAVRRQQSAQGLEALRLAQRECERVGDCGHTRPGQLRALIEIAQGPGEGLQRASTTWLKRIKSGALLATEIQIAWALAEQLHHAGDRHAAAALLQALDTQIDQLRGPMGGSNSNDLIRYEGLKRLRVRIDVESGNLLDPIVTESLRARGLQSRLRSQRLLKELAPDIGNALEVELSQQLAALNPPRQKLQQVLMQPPSNSGPLNTTLVQVLLEEIDGSEEFLRNNYLNKLAAQKQKVLGDYFSEPSALYRYERSETMRTQDSPLPKADLDNSDAYLSWLGVPGGYVGTLLAVAPRDRALPLRPHIKLQKFIAFGPQEEAALKLYRNLLQSGATMSRGARLTSPLEGPDAAGLMLNGLPIWQQTDGSLLASRTAPEGGSRIQSFTNLSDALFERLLAPFATHYQDAQRLIISPDGSLAYLPFETLTRQGVSVLEATNIGYVQSLAVYAELKKRRASKNRKGESRLLSVADPLYTPTTVQPGSAQSGNLRHMDALTWPALPGTRKESAAIVNLYRSKQQLLGATASRNSLLDMQKNDALKSFQVLHFATHGYVDDERSALVLSTGPSTRTSYLMDEDIVNWNLDSDLVLLSACNTGIGRQQNGEGIVGLPYAFFMAGNINTLMSLWPVDDEGTATLMPAFMNRIQGGEDHVSALNSTKRAFARGDYGQALRNPRIWSAFVMYGVP